MTDSAYSQSLAILARSGSVLSAAGIMFCVFAPHWVVPRIVYSYHVEHFAAFFLLATLASAASPKRPLGELCVVLALFAGLTEIARLLPSTHRLYNLENLACDWPASCPHCLLSPLAGSELYRPNGLNGNFDDNTRV